MIDLLTKLDSATKYPSIPTYHELDPKTGVHLETVTLFDGTGKVILTEKVDGANARIVVMPDGDWFIGSRKEILYARGDRIINPELGIVETLLPLAEQLSQKPKTASNYIQVFFLEVYGHNIAGSHKQYATKPGQISYRLFDLAFVPVEILDKTVEQIASWREHGGQKWATEKVLARCARTEGIDLTPRLGFVEAENLPATVEDTHTWLKGMLPHTLVALDEAAGRRGEGIVLRSEDRTTIAKARFQTYERTLRQRQSAKQ